MVALNYVEPPSFDYFNKLWNIHYSLVITETDRPICVECYKYNTDIK